MRCETYSGKKANPGPKGRNAPPPLSGTPGSDGLADIQNDNHQNDDYFGEQLTPLLGKMLLRQSILDHLNGEHESSAKRLGWLHELLKPRTARTANHSFMLDADVGGDDTVPDHEFEELRIQTAIQLSRLQLGLDAFGNTATFIPMLTYRSYEGYIARWLDSSEKAEEIYEEYYNENRDQIISLNAAERALAGLDQTISNLQQDILEAEEHRERLQNEITNQLLPAVIRASNRLQASSEVFKEAVRNHANGCEFGDVLKAVGSLVAMAKGGVGAIAAVGPVIDAVRSDEENIFKYLGTIAKKIEDVSKEVNKVEGAYNKLKDALAHDTIPNIPSDSAKILVQREAILEKIEPFKHLDSAGPYIDAIDVYVGSVFARNAKIIEHDALVLQVHEAQSKINIARSDKVEIRTKISSTHKPYLAEIELFMNWSLDLHKTELIRAMHYAQRALSYMTLKDQPLIFGRQSVGELRHQYRLLDRQLQEANEYRGRAHQTLGLGHPIAKFSMKRFIGDEGMGKLKAKEQVDFVLPFRAFADYHHVYIDRLRIVAQGIGSNTMQMLGMRFVHSGHAKFVDRNGQYREFTHAARATFAYDGNDQGSSLGGDDEFIALTPYGPWRVDLNLFSNDGIDLSALEDIIVEFEVKYLPNF